MSLSSFMNLVPLVSVSTLRGGVVAAAEGATAVGGVAAEEEEEDRYANSIMYSRLILIILDGYFIIYTCTLVFIHIVFIVGRFWW